MLRGPLGALASALAIVSLALALSHLPSLPVKSDESTMRAESTLRARLNSFVLLTGVLIFMYVGTELPSEAGLPHTRSGSEQRRNRIGR